jgi:predicted nucleic acid-binding protein
MPAYADTSFLVAAYVPEAESTKALQWLQRSRDPLPYTPFHRHELRNGIRLRVFRAEITPEQCRMAFESIDSDLADGVLVHTAIPWTDTLREAERLSAAYTERLGVRSFDLFHVGLALVLGATQFLTFDKRQSVLAQAAGLKITP